MFFPLRMNNLTKLFLLFQILLKSSHMRVFAESLDRNFSLYTEIKPVNCSDSLQRLSSLPIVYYKFLYDSVPDRTLLGVVGPEAQRLFPEAVEVLPSTAFSTGRDVNSATKRSTLSIVTSFPVVDKSVLFMHGIAAIQELLLRYKSIEDQLRKYIEENMILSDEIDRFESFLRQDASSSMLNRLETMKSQELLEQSRFAAEDAAFLSEQQKNAHQLKEERKLLQYEESLAISRLSVQEEFMHQAMLQQINLEKEILAKKEYMNEEYHNKLVVERMKNINDIEQQKMLFEKERVSTEMEAKAKVEKMNEEIALRKLQTQSRLETERFIQSIKSISIQLSKFIQDIISHPKQLLIVVCVIVLMISIYFVIRELATMVRQFIQTTIGRPILVRETSYKWWLIPQFSYWVDEIWSTSLNVREVEKDFQDIILSADDKRRVTDLATATRNTRKSKAPFRHVLLHGPPGTGKTLIARRLAYCSGMDYALLSGGDIAPLGEDAVNQLHALFRWANKSSKGLLVFIDEAEAFLCSRSHLHGDSNSESHVRNALNALLFQTGSPSRNFMMVLATNRPEDLDAAILDRIDISIKIALPGEVERIELVQLYMNLHINSVLQDSKHFNMFVYIFRMQSDRAQVDSECQSSNSIRNIASRTAGFSGREIAKLFISAQYAMLLSENRTLTWKLLQDVLETKLIEHRLKFSGFDSLNYNIAADGSEKKKVH